jgi:S-adenosylmethionine synthetase
MAKGETIILAGEITTAANVDYAAVARRVCEKLGYHAARVLTYIEQQSPEIAAGVKEGSDEQGAGDQGIMYGYATNETSSKLPFGFDLANRITKKLEEAAAETNSMLKGDAKTQVTVDLDETPTLSSVKKILVSACHKEVFDFDIIKTYIGSLIWSVIDDVAQDEQQKVDARKNIELIINPAGPWTIGGPAADCGLTGRKIVCDQYGGYCPVGGGAFSGKAPSKVARSGAYMARKIACDLLHRYDLRECEVQLAYAIGQARPMSINVRTKLKANRATEDDRRMIEEIAEEWVAKNYDLTPAGIIKALGLKRPIYEKLAGGCHFREV